MSFFSWDNHLQNWQLQYDIWWLSVCQQSSHMITVKLNINKSIHKTWCHVMWHIFNHLQLIIPKTAKNLLLKPKITVCSHENRCEEYMIRFFLQMNRPKQKTLSSFYCCWKEVFYLGKALQRNAVLNKHNRLLVVNIVQSERIYYRAQHWNVSTGGKKSRSGLFLTFIHLI